MPELPEVEVARRFWHRWAVDGRGRTIDRVVVSDDRVIDGEARAFVKALVGRSITRADRRGKWLKLCLDDGASLFSHLGMTGKWVRRPYRERRARFELVRVDLRNDEGRVRSLRYLDPRLLGRLALTAKGAGDDFAPWQSLGPDPLVDGIDVDRLHAALGRTRRTIKEALLDQSVIAGVGNIQATEALWRARIDPRVSARELQRADVAAIADGILTSIRDTLAHEDAHATGDEITYVGESRAKNPFAIYGRGGSPCPRCGATLTRMVIGGRGTVFCAWCVAPRGCNEATV